MKVVRSAAPAALIILLAACGPDAGSARSADGSVEIDMTDNAYSLMKLDVAAGETVTFVFNNKGVLQHEAVFGDAAAQTAHHADMAAAAEETGEETGDDSGDAHAGHGTAEMHAVTVAPGDSLTVEHTFGEAGAIQIGCHIPGHWEAGMKIDVTVT